MQPARAQAIDTGSEFCVGCYRKVTPGDTLLTISALFNELADIFAADVAIETHARAALQ